MDIVWSKYFQGTETKCGDTLTTGKRKSVIQVLVLTEDAYYLWNMWFKMLNKYPSS